MPRYFLQLSYCGASYHGWQNQDNARTVQAGIEGILSRRLNRKMAIVGAGRTDTGVNASNYFSHFDLDAGTDISTLAVDVGHMLPKDISLTGVFPVVADAHARFSALNRQYHYIISTRKDPFLDSLAWTYLPALDVSKMQEAASSLIGIHDFSAFEKLGSDNSHSMCELMAADFSEQGHLLVFNIKANRFLRNMVRSIVGTLIDVGRGKLDTDGFKRLIETRNRSLAGTSAPAHGLYLSGIEYPDEIFPESVPEYHVLPSFLTGIV